MPIAKTKWYAAGLSFGCTQCGNCCSGAPGFVWVTRKEVQAIADHLNRPDGKLDKSELRRVGLRLSLTEKPNGDCIFLERTANGKTLCRIHSVRPVQCRTWPFWESNLESPDTWNSAGRNCPGMNRGKHYDFVTIEGLRKET